MLCAMSVFFFFLLRRYRKTGAQGLLLLAAQEMIAKILYCSVLLNELS